MTVRASLGQLFVRNWPIKLAALFFAIMLYVAVVAQQPLSQTFVMRLAIAIPPGRTVRQQPAGVTVVIAGKGSEILKLRSFPRVIRKVIPDTFSTSLWRIQLQAADVELPKGIDVTVADIRPRDIEILLDSVAHKDVRIVPRVKGEAESGYVLRGLSVTPSLARLVGPEQSLTKLDSVTTLRSEEHTSELQSRLHLVCRLLLEKKKKKMHHVTRAQQITNGLVIDRNAASRL